MTFASPAAWWLLLLAVPIVVLHMLRPRRPAVEVSSTFLWREVARPVSAATPWQRLRPSLLLVLQLLAVALLALAAARPVRPTTAPLSRHSVFIVDTAGSMAARDGRPDRIGSAKAKAKELRSQLPAGGVASIVVAGTQPHVVLSASPDARAFSRAVDGLQAGAGTPDYATAFSLAEGLETPGVPAGFVFLSDGELTGTEARLLPPGTHYVQVGGRATNRAVSALRVEPKGSGLHATVTVRNTGGPAATQDLRFDVDGRTAATITVGLAQGVTVSKGVDLPAGDRVDAFLEGEDLLAADNHAFAVAARRRSLKVLVAGPPGAAAAGDIYIQRFLAASPGVTVITAPATAGPAASPAPAASPVPAATPAPASGPASAPITTLPPTGPPAPGYDLVIYDQVAVPADPAAPFLAIAPPGGMNGVAVTGSIDLPAVTLVKGDNALLANLDLSTVAIARAQKLTDATDQVLVAAEGTPLLLQGSRAGQPFAYLGFALGESNLGVQIAWPILADRLLTALTGAAVPRSDLVAGQPLPLGAAHPALSVTGPAAIDLQVGPDAPAPIASVPGFWSAHQAGRPDTVFAVNADPRQSDLAPAASLPIRPRAQLPGEKRPGGQRFLLRFVVFALLLVLAVELWVEWRARAAPRGQWRAALLLRAAMVTALLAALLAIALPRSERRVAVVFVLDQSDSMGPTGRQLANTWVRDALRGQNKSDLAGVVVFGGDAKVDLTVQHDTAFLAPAAAVDTSRTNLAQALRLAGALLPSDARRRVVVVSDGRANAGDADAEAAALRSEGVRVDAHAVTGSAGPDVALTGLRVPRLVRDGEAFSLQATITSNEAATVGLTLTRDGNVVDQRSVSVTAGDTVVELPQAVAADAPTGVLRFRLDANAPKDQVPQNNVAFAAVPVAGPAQVLLVEGMPGEAHTLGEALKAGGLQVTTVATAALPPVDQLTAYTATVLVDVDANTLASEQTAALRVVSEDLGHGLVVIGGDRSYGLGGYLSSDLEQLLPVVSDVTDPKRKLSVAEVLAIDSSGSMAACHCSGGNGLAGGGNTSNGGVNKTDISRAAAARAIAALDANDQVGVLAFNSEQRWIVPLRALPSEAVVTKGLNSLTPAGGTDLTQPLRRAAEALRATKSQLKHIILFTDGFTSVEALNGLVQQASQLYQQGITVSVLATGEGATAQLQAVATAGHGRFYAGQDLSQVPTIMAQEAVLATRNLAVEGSFFPKVVSSAPVVRDLSASPPLLGYLATTAKPSASTLLTVGENGDPLLASWQAGLGKVTSWTSDASARWSQKWAGWPGYVGFWSTVVKDTFALPGSSGSGVRAETVGDKLRVTVESQQPWPDGATAQAHVADPSLADHTLTLQQTAPTTFVGELPASLAGTYAVGATVSGPSGPVLSATAVATRSFSAEYLPGQPDPAALARVSLLSGGRGAIAAGQVFQPSGLPAGRGAVALSGWFLLVAAVLWPVVVGLGRLALNGAGGVTWSRAASAGRDLFRRPGAGKRGRVPGNSRTSPSGRPVVSGPAEGRPEPEQATDAEVAEVHDVLSPPPTISRLLQRKREGRNPDQGA